MSATASRAVGPVLTSGATTVAVIEALRKLNAGLEVKDFGGYVRAHAQRRCLLSRAEVERTLGGRFELPRDLEQLMVSFRGRMVVSEEQVEWLDP